MARRVIESISLTDAANIVVGTSTGTKIGTATTQKLAFYNSTPVVQPAGTVDVLASLATLGLRAASSNPPLDLGTGTLTCGIANPATGFRIGNAAASNKFLRGDGTNFISGSPLLPSTSATRTGGNISCSQVLTTTWNDFQTATDLTIAAAASDVLLINLAALWNNDGLSAWLDAATIVSAAPVNYIGASGGTADFGVPGWYGPPSVYSPIGGSVLYTVVSGDISGGNVVLRLRYRVGTTVTTKTMFGTAAAPFRWGVVNLGH